MDSVVEPDFLYPIMCTVFLSTKTLADLHTNWRLKKVLQPKFFWDIWDLSDTLSSLVALSFQWVPPAVMLDFQEMNGQTRSPKPEQHSPIPMFPAQCLLAPTITKIRHTRYSLWRLIFLITPSPARSPSVSSEELALLRLIRCELYRLRCHGHSLLLFSYLYMIKRKENSSCRACGHPLQDLTGLSRIRASPARHLWHYLHFDLWSRPWGVARLLGLREVPPRPYLLEGVGYHHPPQKKNELRPFSENTIMKIWSVASSGFIKLPITYCLQESLGFQEHNKNSKRNFASSRIFHLSTQAWLISLYDIK